jgi:L-2,4-diaminobutyrate decarboxylase
MCDLAGYPKESGGLFVSGGSIANLTALTAARDTKLTYNERNKAVIYVSDQTHASVTKGMLIIGFCKDQIRIIPTDNSFCMDISALRAAIKNDIESSKKPFAVIASAGTTNTGSVDPLTEISAICREYDMWLHVDGAFGASVLLSEKYRKNLSGIELSDSLSWDAHKWLLQTYGCSVVLVRNQSTLVHSFAAHPEYLKDAETTAGSIEFWDLGVELTRPARSLKLWLTLQVTGSNEISRMIEHGCAMAELAEKIIRENPDWEIVSPAQLGIVNFRYASNRESSEIDLDTVNQDISKEITESSFAQIFTTELRGKRVLRMCTINPETTEQDIYNTMNRLMAGRN